MLPIIWFTLGIYRSGLWYDEAASVSMATQPLSQILTVAHHQDLVHTLYYIFLHFWSSIFGLSEFSVRFPSVLAGGILSLSLFLVVRRLAGSRVALMVSSMFTVLPMTASMAVQARGFMIASAISFLSIVTLFAWIREGRTRSLVVSIILAIVSALFFLYCILATVAAAVALVSLRHRKAISRRTFRVGLAVQVGIVTAIAPFAYLATRQTWQVAWVADRVTRDPASNLAVLARMPFGDVQWLLPNHLNKLPVGDSAWAVGLMLLMCVMAIVLGNRHRILPGTREAAIFWGVPAFLMLAGQAVLGTVLVPRYLTFTLPYIAFTIIAVTMAIPSRSLRVFLLTALAAICVFTTLDSRAEFPYESYSNAAAAVKSWTAPGDSILVMGEGGTVAMGYPDSFAGRDDLTYASPPTTRVEPGRIGAEQAINKRLTDKDTVWVLDVNSSGPVDDSLGGQLTAKGFRVADTHRGDGWILVGYVR